MISYTEQYKRSINELMSNEYDTPLKTLIWHGINIALTLYHTKMPIPTHSGDFTINMKKYPSIIIKYSHDNKGIRYTDDVMYSEIARYCNKVIKTQAFRTKIVHEGIKCLTEHKIKHKFYSDIKERTFEYDLQSIEIIVSFKSGAIFFRLNPIITLKEYIKCRAFSNRRKLMHTYIIGYDGISSPNILEYKCDILDYLNEVDISVLTN